MKVTRLSKKGQWESHWSKTNTSMLAFDPEQPRFREIHRVLQKHLPQTRDGDFLEVGAYPGKYLWYFHKFFGYKPWGVEYVETCAQQAQEMLDSENIPGQMIVEDIFNLNADEHIEKGGWNLVASLGFVEHFDEPEVAIAKHLEVTLPGGLVMISVPNHAGWNGNILHYVDSEKWRTHNCMSLDNMLAAFKNAGSNEIIFSGHVGHIGFWNTGLYRKLKEIMGRLYPLARAPLWLIEGLGQWLVPNNKYSSPTILVIARKLNEQ